MLPEDMLLRPLHCVIQIFLEDAGDDVSSFCSHAHNYWAVGRYHLLLFYSGCSYRYYSDVNPERYDEKLNLFYFAIWLWSPHYLHFIFGEEKHRICDWSIICSKILFSVLSRGLSNIALLLAPYFRLFIGFDHHRSGISAEEIRHYFFRRFDSFRCRGKVFSNEKNSSIFAGL